MHGNAWMGWASSHGLRDSVGLLGASDGEKPHKLIVVRWNEQAKTIGLLKGD